MSDATPAAPAAQSDAEIAAAAGVAPAKGSKLVPILLGVNFLMIAGIGGLVVMKMGHAEKPAAAAKKGGEHGEAAAEGEHAEEAPAEHDEPIDPKQVAPPGMGPTVRLADFVVHLRDTDAERYARMSFELEIRGDPDKERVTKHLPKIRELFLSYLADRTVEDLRGSEGMERTKKDLLARLQTQAPSAHIRNVFITDIVIQ